MIKKLSEVYIIAGSVTNNGVTTTRPQSLYTRYFFVAMAALFIIIAIAGFVPDYQFIHAQHITLHWFSHVHGAILSCWLLVYFTQAILVAKGNFNYHHTLGQYSVVLGVFVWISMGIVIFRTNIGYPPHENIPWANVLVLQSFMNLFGVFFTWGIIARKNGAVHKRLLFLATLVLISAGYNRILLNAGINPTLQWSVLPVLGSPSILGQPNPSALLLYNDLLLIPLFIYDFITIRRVHKTTLVCSVCIIVIHLSVIAVWSRLP